MNLDKLTPVPWIANQFLAGQGGDNCWKLHAGSSLGRHVADFGSLGEEDCKFTELARNAFDVMMRRGWNPMRWPNGRWCVEDGTGSQHSPGTEGYPDPFTALVEADKWHKENVEK